MKTRLWTAAVIAAVLVFTGTASADPSGSEKDRIDEELAEAEATLEGATEAAREAGLALAEVERALPDAQDRVNTARGLVAAARVLANAAAEDAQLARAEHEQAIADYSVAEQDVVQARNDLGDLVSLSYQGAGIMAINAVLDAKDPFQAVERMSYVEEIATRQSEAVDQVVRLRQDVRNAENVAEVSKDSAVEAEQAAADALEVAEAEQEAAELAQDDLSGLLDTQAAALEIAEAEKDESLARYEEAQAESERIAAALRSAGNGHKTKKSKSNSSSGFLMPVSGWKSSDYGSRYDPYYHVWQLHAGVDFAAGGGAPIYAVAGGTVVQAGWNGGYGNYTCVYHGDNISTCYAHQSAIGVSVGQWVGKGQQIGSVGTTGASTGNHLHFEVRVNGNPVQPLDWLPGCLC